MMSDLRVLLNNINLNQFRRWGVNGGIAILDQGLFSGSNFILNVLLARWLSVSAYGAYAIGFALFLFVTGIYNSLILEPMAVLGPANHKSHSGEYIRSQFHLHIGVTFVIGMPLAVVGALLSTNSGAPGMVGQAVFGTGLFLPIILLIWLVRRIFYVLRRPLGSFFSSSIYMVILLGGSFFVHQRGVQPHLAWWFGILGIAGLLSGLISIAIWSTSFASNEYRTKLRLQAVLEEHWNFGRWVLVATIFSFVATQIQIFAVASILDLDAAGAWRAMQNFILPMMQIITAIATLSLPAIAIDFGHGELRAVNRKGLFVSAALLSIAVIYTLILLAFSSSINEWLYHDKFMAYQEILPLIGLVPILAAAETGFSLILRSMQRPKYYLIYTVAMSVSALLFGPLLIWLLNLTGAAMSQIAVGIASLSVNLYLYKTWFGTPQTEEPALSNGAS